MGGAALGLVATLTGCGGAEGWRSRAGAVEARSYLYKDNANLTVSTTSVEVAQPISRSWTVRGRGLVDYIHIEPKAVDDHTDVSGQPTGHCHTDGCVEVVTAASARVADEPVDKWRYEAVSGLEASGTPGDLPARVSVQGRVSYEEDYLAVSAIARSDVELFDRNTIVSGFVGGGHDRVAPDVAPPGEQGLWPATHGRIGGGLTVVQLLSPILVGSGGLALTHQGGTLESPYRRARVLTTLFPEAVPETRERFTAFTELLWSVHPTLALRGRQGVYVDTWGVLATIPEVEAMQEIGPDVLVALSYRYYHQLPASFYAAQYQGIEALMSSDIRLGEVRDHLPGLRVAWQAVGERGGFGSLALEASHQVSFMSYVSAGADVVGHVTGIAVILGY